MTFALTLGFEIILIGNPLGRKKTPTFSFRSPLPPQFCSLKCLTGRLDGLAGANETLHAEKPHKLWEDQV